MLYLFAFGLTQLGMLWWLAAAAAPLLIHLWNRRRYREVPWAAIEHLLAALKKSARRMRFEQWLLLAIRTALIVCVVLAVAGPYIEQIGGRFAAGQPVHRVIVLDGSYSMAYKPGDKTRFEMAKDLVRDLVARSSQGDGFSLVLMSTPARTVVGTPAFVSDDARRALQELQHPAGDTTAAERIAGDDDFLKELRDLRLPQGGGDLAGALDRVDEILAQSQREYPRLASTEVYFLTDLGRTSWTPAATSDAGHVRQRLVKLGKAARLAVADLGQENCDNLAITSLHATQPLFTTRTPVDFQAEVHNFGSRQHHAQAELWVDGHRVGERDVDLAPQGQQSVSFTHRFETSGDHAVEVRLTGDANDRLDIDNHRWLVAPVKQSLSVLLVNGEGAAENTRYLYDALDPYRDGSAGLPLRIERVPDGSLLEQNLSPGGFDAVFLSNVSQFTPAEARLLADYARGGGGLVFFLGDRVDATRYNEELGGGRPGAPRLLPTLLDQPSAVGRYAFDPLDYRDGLLRDFRGNERAGLLSTSITRYFRLRPVAVKDSGSLPGAQTALVIGQTGDPIIVCAPVPGAIDSGAPLPDGRGSRAHVNESRDRQGAVATGTIPNPDSRTPSPAPPAGRAILVALPASFASVDPATKEPWSNWPLKASFQPIVQNLLLAAIGPQGLDRNVLVGQPLDSTLPAGDSTGALELQTPDGRKEQIRVAARDEANRWSFAPTWQSGIYRAEFPSAASDERLFAVNVNTIESDLSRIAPDQLPEGVTVVATPSQTADHGAADLDVRSGQQMWLLYAALALLLLETVLAWWFGYRAK